MHVTVSRVTVSRVTVSRWQLAGDSEQVIVSRGPWAGDSEQVTLTVLAGDCEQESVWAAQLGQLYLDRYLWTSPCVQPCNYKFYKLLSSLLSLTSSDRVIYISYLNHLLLQPPVNSSGIVPWVHPPHIFIDLLCAGLGRRLRRVSWWILDKSGR